MFTKKLTEKLVKFQVIRNNSVIKTNIEVKDYLGYPIIKIADLCVVGYAIKDDFIKFKCIDPSTNKSYMIKNSEIQELDGMNASRICALYNLSNDGDKKIVKIDPLTGNPLKRGRKSKRDLEAMSKMRMVA